MDTQKLSKFYKKSIDDRIQSLFQAGAISQDQATALSNNHYQLDASVGDNMIENYITNHDLPLGIGMNFVIDGKETLVPMAIEEPSVVAAASNAAKMIKQSGGFTTDTSPRHMIGQVSLYDVPDIDQATATIKAHEADLIQAANQANPSILQFGGGARSIQVRFIEADPAFDTPDYLVVHLIVDTQDAMGANTINTMVEAISPLLEEYSKGTKLMGILSNYATECLATAKCRVHPDDLAKGEFSGEEVRDRIVQASKWATADPYRAVTHNKGIMNGLDAVVMATGNDWRAVEAGVHAYASRSGQYRSLTTWTVDDDGYLLGELTLPLAVGTVGGAINLHPIAQFSLSLMDVTKAVDLERILVSVGLAQNLAAIRALVSEGIQEGHMKLHARSVAIAAGASEDQLDSVVDQLIEAGEINIERAKEIINNI